MDQVAFSHRFIEKPHCSKDTDELTDAAQIVKWDVFNRKRRLKVNNQSVKTQFVLFVKLGWFYLQCVSSYLTFLSVESHSGEDDQVRQVNQEIH